jgi:RHS repeat-associated protein
VLAYNRRFPGQYFDAETGKHYNYFRDYDPSIGRYIESDPIGLKAGLNTYAYVESAPLDDVDFFGLANGGGKGLPQSKPCNRDDWKVCEGRCPYGVVDGCYVTIKWRVGGMRNGELIRGEERRVECNCKPCPSDKTNSVPIKSPPWWLFILVPFPGNPLYW